MPAPALHAIAVTLCCLIGSASVAFGQAAAVPEPVRALAGAWEMSNADRDRTCTVSLRAVRAGPGFALQWEPKCAEMFPFSTSATAWQISPRDALQFLNAGGSVLMELTEVEGGLYEGERRGQGLVFLQSMASRAGEERTPEQLAGDWGFMAATGKLLCRIALAATQTETGTLALSVQPGCDAAIARFAPVAWQIDRGQLVLLSRRGDAWRFEEVDALSWRRIPAGRQPLTLVKQ